MQKIACERNVTRRCQAVRRAGDLRLWSWFHSRWNFTSEKHCGKGCKSWFSILHMAEFMTRKTLSRMHYKSTVQLNDKVYPLLLYDVHLLLQFALFTLTITLQLYTIQSDTTIISYIDKCNISLQWFVMTGCFQLICYWTLTNWTAVFKLFQI